MTIRIDTIKNIKGFPALVKNVPPNYPNRPAPGKISLLFNSNSTDIYHKFSPYTSGDSIFGLFPNRQPFVYRFVDEAHKSLFNTLPKAVKTLVNTVNVPAAVDDVIRVSKFSISPQGVIYNAKQIVLQTLNSFDETRIYNPLSPLLATVQPASIGLLNRPTRHIELSFNGALNALGLSFTGIGLLSNIAPSSTVGSAALPNSNKQDGKGLLRGGDANRASTTLNNKWQGSPGILGSLLTGITNIARNAASTLFGGFNKSSGQFRADEKTYDLMIGSNKIPIQRWVAKNNVYGTVLQVTKDGSAKSSEMISSFNDFVDKNNIFPSKFDNIQSENVKNVNENLKKVISSINTKTLGSYNVLTNTYSRLLSSGQIETPAASGYGRISSIKTNAGTPKNQYGVGLDYSSLSGPKPIDNHFSSRNLRIATTFTSDGLNRLGVIQKNQSVPSEVQSVFPGWKKWEPYEDDLIAFFFYDVVNQKYIPFRATVKSISEGNTAIWDELRFIGRSDLLFSYGGFSRTLSFTFNVVINSVTELLPSWQKINYIASSVKPSNYTSNGKIGGPFNRFIVPPMFMLTIGDLYKFQPMVITSVNVNIPDDASWETLNEQNSTEWSYLTKIIKSPNLGKRYAQLPKEVEIVITCNLLEKERSILGGSHFGHAPKPDDFGQFNIETKEPNLSFLENGNSAFLPKVTEFHKEMTENNIILETTGLTNEDRVRIANNQSTIVSSNQSSNIDTNKPTTTPISLLARSTQLSNGANPLGSAGQNTTIEKITQLQNGPNPLGSKGRAVTLNP